MMLYATKLTYDRLHIKSGETLFYALDSIYPQYNYIENRKKFENWSVIYEWYVELFYYGTHKCLRIVHLASMFTMFFDDVDEKFMPGLGFSIRKQLFKYFYADEETTKYLDWLFYDSPISFYSRIKDVSRFKAYKFDEYKFDKNNTFFKRFISENSIDTVALNKAVNSEYEFKGLSDGKKEVFHSEERLKSILRSIYSDTEREKKTVVIKQKLVLTQYEMDVYSK